MYIEALQEAGLGPDLTLQLAEQLLCQPAADVPHLDRQRAIFLKYVQVRPRRRHYFNGVYTEVSMKTVQIVICIVIKQDPQWSYSTVRSID